MQHSIVVRVWRTLQYCIKHIPGALVVTDNDCYAFKSSQSTGAPVGLQIYWADSVILIITKAFIFEFHWKPVRVYACLCVCVSVCVFVFAVRVARSTNYRSLRQSHFTFLLTSIRGEHFKRLININWRTRALESPAHKTHRLFCLSIHLLRKRKNNMCVALNIYMLYGVQLTTIEQPCILMSI